MPITPQLLVFPGDGATPNSPLPVLWYRDVLNRLELDGAAGLERTFASNGWTNNWRDIIMARDHYHSSSHEVLGIAEGRVRVRIGGAEGEEIRAETGDVFVVPAGVGHLSLQAQHEEYLVVGGYPDGRSWDMIYAEPEKYDIAVEAIAALPIPLTDPLFGPDGPLTTLWR